MDSTRIKKLKLVFHNLYNIFDKKAIGVASGEPAKARELAQSIEYWTCDLGECIEPGSSLGNLRKYWSFSKTVEFTPSKCTLCWVGPCILQGP